jgi:hypothetical protein
VAKEMQINLQAILTAAAPVLFAAVGYLMTSLNEQENRLYLVESRMMQLVTPDGAIVPSPDNAIARQQLREAIMLPIHDLQVRVSLLEAQKGQ